MGSRTRTGSRRRVLGAAVGAFALLTSCGGGDDGSGGGTVVASPVATDRAVSEPAVTEPSATEPAVTEPAATEPAATEPAVSEPAVSEPMVTEPVVSDPSSDDSVPDPPPDLSFLWNDVETFVAAWAATNESLAETDPGVEPVVLTVGDLRIEAMPSAGDGFSATEVEPAGYVAGTIDPGGEVSAIVTVVDPLSERGPLLLATSMLTLTDQWTADGLDTDEFLAETEAGYLSLETDAASRIGEQVFVRGPFGTLYSGVLTVIDGGDRAAALIEVAVIPVDDEQLALSIVEVLRTEMTGLLS